MRVLFQKGEQRHFILRCCNGKSLKEFLKSSSIKLSYSTLKEYAREEFTLPENIFVKLCEAGKINKKPFNFELLPDNWGAIKGGRIGIKTLFEKYPSELKKWRAKGWRNARPHLIRLKSVKIPPLNEKLAELIGVYLGDGTLTNYFVKITGDKRYDILYFKYLSNLIEDLIGSRPSIHEEKSRNQLYLELYSKTFCEHLIKQYNIHPGSKIRNKTIIPVEIINDEKLFFACLRGLIDTDGSVSKDNNQLSIRFHNHNSFLLNQIKNLNKKYRLFSFETEKQVGVKNLNGVRRYFKLVGSSNIRHIVRFREYLKGNLVKKENVLKYYNIYKDMELPYYDGPVV